MRRAETAEVQRDREERRWKRAESHLQSFRAVEERLRAVAGVGLLSAVPAPGETSAEISVESLWSRLQEAVQHDVRVRSFLCSFHSVRFYAMYACCVC